VNEHAHRHEDSNSVSDPGFRPGRAFFLGLISSQSARGAPGDVDLSFDPGSGVDGPVNAIVVQRDGKVIIGGDFTMVKGLVRKDLARLNADGSGDSSFAPPPSLSAAESSSVSSLALQPNGKVIVTYYQYESEIESYGLTRLDSDGTVDPTFHLDPKAISNRGVTVIVQPDGKLLCNGMFRLNADGSIDDSFQSVVTGASLLTRQPDGKVIIAGRYANLLLFVLRLETNGSIDPSFHAEIEDPSWVYSAVVQADGKLLLAGDRLRVNGNVTMIARFNSDGSVDTTFGLVTDFSGFGEIRDVALQPDGKMIVGGRFQALNGSTRNNLARLNADGTVDLSFPSGPGGGWGEVSEIAQDANGWILIVRGAVVRLHADGSADPAFEPGRSPASLPLSMAVAPDGKVLIGGYLVRPYNSGGVNLAPICRVDANGSGDNGFNPGAGPNSDVMSVASQPDGKVLIGGRFTSVNGTNCDALARLNADGSLDESFNPPLAAIAPFDGVPPGYVGSFERAVTATAVQADGKIVVAGYNYTWAENLALEDGFATWRYFVFRFQANGNHDAGFAGSVGVQDAGTFFPPTSLVIQPDGKIVFAGHRVFSIGGSTRSGILRLNADGNLDAGFLPEPRVSASFIYAIALQPDGKMVVAGYLSGPNGHANEVVRFNANGSPDATFVPGTGPLGGVSEVAVQPDGKVLIGGSFTAFNGTPRNRIARLNANGSLDIGFNPGTGPDGNISALALQADGAVLIGGDFVTVNGVLRPRVARLYGDSLPPPATFAAWVTGFGLSGAAAAPDADPDDDGLASGIEFVLSGNPTLPASSSLPALTTSGGNVVITFPRDDASEVNGMTLTVESGTDLVSWPAVFTIGPNTAASSPGVTIVENGNAPDTITVVITAGPRNARFARLKATIAP
jgi:uncharacterized delta-60 repeat protein